MERQKKIPESSYIPAGSAQRGGEGWREKLVIHQRGLAGGWQRSLRAAWFQRGLPLHGPGSSFGFPAEDHGFQTGLGMQSARAQKEGKPRGQDGMLPESIRETSSQKLRWEASVT